MDVICIHDLIFVIKSIRQECLGNTIRSDQVMILLACNIRIGILWAYN